MNEENEYEELFDANNDDEEDEEGFYFEEDGDIYYCGYEEEDAK